MLYHAKVICWSFVGLAHFMLDYPVTPNSDLNAIPKFPKEPLALNIELK